MSVRHKLFSTNLRVFQLFMTHKSNSHCLRCSMECQWNCYKKFINF